MQRLIYIALKHINTCEQAVSTGKFSLLSSIKHFTPFGQIQSRINNNRFQFPCSTSTKQMENKYHSCRPYNFNHQSLQFQCKTNNNNSNRITQEHKLTLSIQYNLNDSQSSNPQAERTKCGEDLTNHKRFIIKIPNTWLQATYKNSKTSLQLLKEKKSSFSSLKNENFNHYSPLSFNT